MGIFDIFKKNNNVERGKEAEDLARNHYEMQGYKVTRTGIGSDLRIQKFHPLTGDVIEDRKIEVKRNNSRLSPRQRKERNSTVTRVKDDYFMPTMTEENKRGQRIETDYLTGRRYAVRKTKKKDDDLFGLSGDGIFGSSSSGRKRSSRSNSNDIFGSGSDLFGGSSSRTKKRRKSKDPFDIDLGF